MSNDFFSVSGVPSTQATLSSATIRAELFAIQAGFDKMPGLTGNGSKAVVVNAGGTALGVTTGTLALAGNFSTVGAFSMALTATGATAVTLPTTGTLATLAGAEEFTNKTLTSAVGKGTWTASGTWTLPAFTLGGTVALGGQSFSGTCANGGTFTTIDINGGTVDGATVGAASRSTGAFSFLGIGVASTPAVGAYITPALSGSTSQYGVLCQPTFGSGATSDGNALCGQVATAAAAFTMGAAHGFRVLDASKGAGSTITELMGLRVDDQTAGVTNIGFRGQVSAGSNKWNIYIDGTAPSYLAGHLGIGATSKLFLDGDGSGDTYLTEVSANTIRVVAGGGNSFQFDTNNTVDEARALIGVGGSIGLVRILFGAADSGGAGYRMMRVTNY